MFDQDTIIATATPQGLGALAMLRISGDEAHTLFARMTNNPDKVAAAQPFKMQLYTLVDGQGTPLDEVTATLFRAPRSFTGENMVELTCHGGTIIVERLVARAIELGARYASRGEFSRRAFLSGKVDLKKAESINRLIHAESLAAHKSAMKHYLGEDRHFFDSLTGQLRQLLVMLETEIEFSETDEVGNEEQFRSQISTLLVAMKKDLHHEISKRSLLKKIDQGITVSLIGRANAGKSSILNRLVGYDRAIVNATAGTTRDLITETVQIEGLKVRLVDTAGLNETENEVELEGIKRTKSVLEESDILCWVIAQNEPLHTEDFSAFPEATPRIVILNKSDLPRHPSVEMLLTTSSPLTLSTINNEGVDHLLTALGTLVRTRYAEESYESVIGSDREEGVIQKILAELEQVDLHQSWDIIAASLHLVLGYFEEIYGKISPDDIMHQVFDQFCIGK